MNARALLGCLALCCFSTLGQDVDPRARLSEVIQDEQRLLDLLRRVREGRPVAANELLAPPPPPRELVVDEDPESAFAQAELHDEGSPPPQEHSPAKAADPPSSTVSPVQSSTRTAAEPTTAPALATEHTDPQRVGDAYLVTGDAVAALDAYERAAEHAEVTGAADQLARARYGVARALEQLGQLEEAAEAYTTVEKLPEAGLWADAAKFARTFIRWRLQVADPNLVLKETR